MLKGKKTKPDQSIDSWVGPMTSVEGAFRIRGGLHVDGQIVGSVVAQDTEKCVVTVSEHGHIQGDVRAPFVVLNGNLEGDLYASERVELAPKARVKGNVYYKVIEMSAGAEVNGRLVHETEPTKHLAGPNRKDSAQAEPEKRVGKNAKQN